jgi:hypothetical protein
VSWTIQLQVAFKVISSGDLMCIRASLNGSMQLGKKEKKWNPKRDLKIVIAVLFGRGVQGRRGPVCWLGWLTKKRLSSGFWSLLTLKCW